MILRSPPTDVNQIDKFTISGTQSIRKLWRETQSARDPDVPNHVTSAANSESARAHLSTAHLLDKINTIPRRRVNALHRPTRKSNTPGNASL